VRHGGWVTWTWDRAIFLEDLVGRVVSIGAKNGMAYEAATVTGIDKRSGFLTTDGGGRGRPVMEPGEAGPLDRPEVIGPYDIARGYVSPQARSA
jgi:hypothetical protein